MAEFEPPLQRLREEVQRLGGAIAEFDTTVNNKVTELYPQFLEGKSGDEYLESAILLGEAVRDTVGSRPLLEAQKGRLERAIKIGELAEEGLFGKRVGEIFGRTQEVLRESGILLDETVAVTQEPVVAQEITAETETTDKIEFSIGPIDYKGRENEVVAHSILKAKLTEDPTLIFPNGQELDIPGENRKKLVNLVRSLPDGMAVFKKSVIAAFGISSQAVDTAVFQTRRILEGSKYDHTIGNASKGSAEGRYYWKHIEQQVGEGVHNADEEQTLQEDDESLVTDVATEGGEIGVSVEPTSGNGEITGIEVEGEEVEHEESRDEEAIASAETIDAATIDSMMGGEEAVRRMEDLLEQNLRYLDSRGSGAIETLSDRLPIIAEDELGKLSEYDKDQIERIVGRLPKGSRDVDFSKISFRVVQLLRFTAAFWTGRLQTYNPELSEISYDRLREVTRDYLHLDNLYIRAYPHAENLPLLVIDLAQKVRDRVSEKKSGG